MDVLEKIFSSPAQLKAMRLFLYNPDTVFDMGSVKRKTQLSSRVAAKELHRLSAADFVRERMVARVRGA